MKIAGKVKTLPMYLYEQFMSSFQYGRGSIAGFVLLIPSVISFVFDLIFKDQSSEKQNSRNTPAAAQDAACTARVSRSVCRPIFSAIVILPFRMMSALVFPRIAQSIRVFPAAAHRIGT